MIAIKKKSEFSNNKYIHSPCKIKKKQFFFLCLLLLLFFFLQQRW